ncbi:CYP38 [Symbiodinium natans]|uniref:peptidylprolyl isomerase n=1 Tax=Symbiodinium natans TaxID=878477 RepID=A0A812I952_9DINO|nr:CYP38 [Symbiodinium natans]
MASVPLCALAQLGLQTSSRAVLEWTLIRGPESGATKYIMDEELVPEAKFTMIIDGWSAPLSAGNFLDLVQRKFYNGLTITRADGFIIQTGDPGADQGNGFSPGPGQPVRTIPLEVGIRGRKEALYGETVDEARLVGTEVKTPFQVDGTFALARREFDNDSELALLLPCNMSPIPEREPSDLNVRCCAVLAFALFAGAGALQWE